MVGLRPGTWLQEPVWGDLRQQEQPPERVNGRDVIDAVGTTGRLDMRSGKNRWIASSALLIGSLVLASCNMLRARHTSVWLDVPLDGLSFPAIQEIKIEGHATGASGISRVEVWIEGALLETIRVSGAEGDLAPFHTAWTPAATGTYTIQAVAYGRDGSTSAPDAARVTFGGATPVPVAGCPSPVGGGPTPVSCGLVGCPSPVGGGATPVSCTPVGCPSPVGGGATPVTCATLPVITVVVPGGDVQFWADPATITAGACTNVRWHAANVKAVVFGGTSQPLDGSYGACLCEDERYSLIVTHLDGREERLSLDIPVEGECVTPEPADTTPPPVPQPAVPANGLTIGCKGDQTLAWLPVADASKIAEYRVQVQRHSGDGNWQGAPGSPMSATDKQVSVNVECGWYYHWRVRAVDGVGNESAFSDWSAFTITLE